MKVILSVPDEGYSECTLWKLFWVYLMKVILSVPDEGYSECTWRRLFWVYLMKVILSVPDEGYSRNASCALDLISTVLIQHFDKRRILYWTFPDEYPSESVQGAFTSSSIIWVGIQNLKKSLCSIVGHDFCDRSTVFDLYKIIDKIVFWWNLIIFKVILFIKYDGISQCKGD